MIKRLLFLILLCAGTAYGQVQVFMPLSGTAGTSPTTASLNSATTSCDGGSNTGTSTAGLTYATTSGAPPFPAATTVCATPLLGNATTSLAWSTSATPSVNFGRHFTSTANASAGLYFCADFSAMGDGAHEYSNVAFEDGSGHTSNIILTQYGIQLETASGGSGSSGVAYTGGSCTTDPTAWRWVTWNYTNTGTDTLKVYDYTATTLLGTLTGSGAGQTNVGVLVIGITGAEGELTGHNLYWRNILLNPTSATLILPNTATHLWSGVLDPARAMDWNTAGVIGGIPSASWSQCTNTACNTVTSAGASATAAQINSALSGAPNNTYVLLQGGTYSITAPITVTRSNVVLRCTAACNLVATSGVGSNNIVSATGSLGSSSAYVEWTSGYAQYGTQLTLASIPSGTVANQSYAVMDECNTGYSGDVCSGTETDNGNLFICWQQWVSSSSGCAGDGPDGSPDGTANRPHLEISLVTNITGNVITIQDPLAYPDWVSGRTPHVYTFNPISNVGIEGLTINGAAMASGNSNSAISLKGCSNCWVTGNSIIQSPEHGIGLDGCVHCTVESNYGQGTNTGVAHFTALFFDAHDLIDNNIAVGFVPMFHCEATCLGDVESYNAGFAGFASTAQSDNVASCFDDHSLGDAYNLREGNFCTLIQHDIQHGAVPLETNFRNFLKGWDSCGNSQCGASSAKDFQTTTALMAAYSRFDNWIGNVLGTPGVQTTYTSTSTFNATIFAVGIGADAAPNDSVVSSTMMLWGNYDTKNAATRFNCAEVPSGLSVLPNPCPANNTLPPSFYLTSRPSWWPASIPFPAVGPDVTGGNIGICSGSLNVAGKQNGLPAENNGQCVNNGFSASAWGGHVNAIPALHCALSIMGLLPDSSNGPFTFNASACYSGVQIVPTAPAPGMFTIKLSGLLKSLDWRFGQ